MEIELPGPVERAWRCVGDVEGLTNWYSPEAEVVPGEGGRIRTRWNEDFDFDETILRWEPPYLLRTQWGGSAGLPTTLEIQLSESVTGTRLQLVHSGIGRGQEWDYFLDSVTRGWAFELRALRHYLANHFGIRRDFVFATKRVPLSTKDAWEALGSKRGFGFLSLEDDLASGGKFDLRTPYGERMTGIVSILNPPKDFVATWFGLDNAFFRWQIDDGPDGASVFCSVNAYGIGAQRRAEIERDWRAVLERAFEEVPLEESAAAVVPPPVAEPPPATLDLDEILGQLRPDGPESGF
jgi:uncharacterized protein YndB with AHSA1/START domain